MQINDNEMYTVYQLVKENAFKGVAPTIMSYIQFIGRQTLKGNYLKAKDKENNRIGYKIKGKDLQKFISNIKL